MVNSLIISIFTILKQTTLLTIKRQRAMSTVDKSKIKAFFSDIEKMLTVNGDYILVDDNMELQSWCIYTVKNGKLYDNISFDMEPRAYNKDDFNDLKDYSEGMQFALLTKQFESYYPD